MLIMWNLQLHNHRTTLPAFGAASYLDVVLFSYGFSLSGTSPNVSSQNCKVNHLLAPTLDIISNSEQEHKQDHSKLPNRFLKR